MGPREQNLQQGTFELDASVREAIECVSQAAREIVSPSRRLKVQEVARLLGLTRQTVELIPEDELPVLRVGPSRKRRRYRQVDVLRYEQGLPPISWNELIEDLAPLRPNANVRPINPMDRTKVI